MVKRKEKNKNDYKIIISELGVNPFHVTNIIFALMCIIPLLVICYIIVGKHFIYDLFLDENGIEMTTAIFIAFAGLLYAYQLVRTLIEKLLRYAEDSRIASNEKTDILIAVSNDLKVPLKALRAGMYKLMSSAGDALKGASAETAKDCLDAAETMDRFIEEITNFSKAGFIRMGIRREFIDLRNIIQTEVDGVTQLAKKKNLNLQCSFAAGSTNLWGDEKKLSRAVASLLSNAIKYTPAEGVVNIAVLSDENTIQFSVKNTGPWLLPDETNKIFEKSARPDNYSGAKDTMVELSIVKDIVDLHNGHITVSSDPGGETEFKVVLPRDLRMRRGMQEVRRRTADETSFATMNIAEILNQKLKNLINSYRADAGKMELKREYIEISPLIDEAISNYEMRLSAKRLTIKKYIPQGIGALWADRDKLREVIANLLNNAVKRTLPGGKIAIKIIESENEMRFEVSDAGAGIAKENLEKLFDKPEHVTTENLEDVALDFPITRNIVELHKGKIWAESEPGKGSRFIFTLPRDPRKGGSRPISQ
ncbi:MAG: ATP-binding protein [Candidatus Omnitrophica bacterium]|nr:ATP-binding protein [Candidatus Omnitrophota bacterium]